MSTQSRRDRHEAGREQVAIWINTEDRQRITTLGEAWGMPLQRDVIREALKRAMAMLEMGTPL
jgi:hypothetical protein